MYAFKHVRHSNIVEDDYRVLIQVTHDEEGFFYLILDFGKQSVIAMVSIKKWDHRPGPDLYYWLWKMMIKLIDQMISHDFLLNKK